MKRKCLAYDINPSREDIIKWDVTKGYPSEAKNCDLIFLDPPYYKKKESEYGEQSVSVLNRKEFLNFMNKLARDSYETMREGGYVALLFGDYIDYQHPEESLLAPNIALAFRNAGFNITCRAQASLTTERFEAHDVKYARENKRLLSTTRDLYVFRKEKVRGGGVERLIKAFKRFKRLIKAFRRWAKTRLLSSTSKGATAPTPAPRRRTLKNNSESKPNLALFFADYFDFYWKSK